MRKTLMIVFALGVFCSARPCLTQLSHQEIKAERFIEYIIVASPYTEWPKWPEKGEEHRTRASNGHGPLVTVYVNQPALESIRLKKGMAAGAIIVAENYEASRQSVVLTTMYKVPGYNRDAGDWYWLEATPGGRVMRFGKVGACIDCHHSQERNDYIWTAEVVSGAHADKQSR